MKELDAIVEIIVNEYPAVQAVYLFGSRARGEEWEDSDLDLALLLPPSLAKEVGVLAGTDLHRRLEELLLKDVDLVNLREVHTVLQKEVVAANSRIYTEDITAAEEFEMLTLSKYQKLNEERAGIIGDVLAGGRFYG